MYVFTLRKWIGNSYYRFGEIVLTKSFGKYDQIIDK